MGKEWYQKNKEKVLEKKRLQYREKNPEIKNKPSSPERLKQQRIEAERRYVKNNQEKVKLRRAKYFQENKEKINERRMSNPNTRLAVNLRARLRSLLKKKKKIGSAARDLGCSIEELRVHLESQFLPGMTWENYGPYGWHIDHIIPLSSFNLQNKEEFLKACHYSNLQPLWREDNLKKGNKITAKQNL